MIPYIQVPPVHIGPLLMEPFGILVALGCVAGWLVARREASLRGLDPAAIDGCLFWALVPGFFASRLFELAFYHPAQLIAQPWSVLFFWQSMSSFGGFIGGAAGTLGYFHHTRRPLMPYAECLLVGFVVGWFFGRLGCTIVHDHPGIHSDFFLAVRYPDGARHDLGFYEWLFTIVMAIVIFRMDRARLPPGLLIGGVCLAYAPVRFLLDFLRVADIRYYGLTAGQYACVTLFGVGLWLVWHASGRTAQPSHEGEPQPN
jgi:phosphatidylglycerol:prolipoprotein diacylglycerol transferase